MGVLPKGWTHLKHPVSFEEGRAFLKQIRTLTQSSVVARPKSGITVSAFARKADAFTAPNTAEMKTTMGMTKTIHKQAQRSLDSQQVQAPLSAKTPYESLKSTPHPREDTSTDTFVTTTMETKALRDCVPEPLGDDSNRERAERSSSQKKSWFKDSVLAQRLHKSEHEADEQFAYALEDEDSEDFSDGEIEADNSLYYESSDEQDEWDETPHARRRLGRLPAVSFDWQRVSDGIIHAYDVFMDALRSRAARRIALAVAACVLVVGFLYQPMRNLYVAQRQEQILTTRLEYIKSENEELENRLNTLQSREGIETEARKRGYVYEGEQLVDVVGLPEEENPPASAKIEPTQESNLITNVLDFAFAFNPDMI
ncbi:MAG: septum formation initiator family protein [Atopobiaceae bacterium]|nr:septum formation initiator family protein [Atopobiaceae bacterium]